MEIEPDGNAEDFAAFKERDARTTALNHAVEMFGSSGDLAEVLQAAAAFRAFLLAKADA